MWAAAVWAAVVWAAAVWAAVVWAVVVWAEVVWAVVVWVVAARGLLIVLLRSGSAACQQLGVSLHEVRLYKGRFINTEHRAKKQVSSKLAHPPAILGTLPPLSGSWAPREQDCFAYW